MVTYPDWLTATLASDAADGHGILPAWIHPLSPDSRVVGPAFVVLTSQDDNLILGQALQAPPPAGSVLVVGGQSTSRNATIGDITALEIKLLGVAGLVTDGLVRDARGIRDVGLDVWCRGTTPAAPGKRGPGEIGGSLVLGGTLIRDGDLVIADEDGVVVWPMADIETLLPRAQARLESDNARIAALRRTPVSPGG